MRTPNLLRLPVPAIDRAAASVAEAIAEVVTEAIAVGRAAAYYPTGLSDSLSDRLSSPRWIGGPLRQLPVLLVHGIWHNQSWSAQLERQLAERGYSCWSVNYRTIGCDVEDAAAQVATYARELADRHGVDQIHAVGHSLGGVVLHAAAVHHGLDTLLASVTTLGSPHKGTPLASLLARRLPGARQMLADISSNSGYLRSLDEDTNGVTSATQWTAVYSVLDEAVPGRRARLDHPSLRANNVAVSGGHLSLMYSPAVLAVILNSLERAEATYVDTQLSVPA